MRTETNGIDQAKLEAVATLAFSDLSAGYAGILMTLGHKLGIYRAMAGAGPLTSGEVAARAGCAERYVREWLCSQVASGYLDYHAVSDTFELSPEQALVLADEESPTFFPHAWNVAACLWSDEARAIDAFRTGAGIPWGDRDGRLACGVAAFYRNGYRANLVPEWLPALDGVVGKLADGCSVADVGCGYGHSAVLMAQAFPRSRFYGFDPHEGSIVAARGIAGDAGVGDRVVFEPARADGYGGGPYQLICFFDSLHDLGDPIAALRHAASVLAPDGTVLLVEPFAKDRVEDNITPVGRLFYGGSTLICCAHSISEGGRLVLGAQAGPARLSEVLRKAGFSRIRVAKETPFNLIIEARL